MQGYETGVAPKEVTFTGAGTRTQVAGRTGGPNLKALRHASPSTGTTYLLRHALGASLTTGTVGYAVRRIGATLSGTPVLFRCYEGTTIIHLNVSWDSATGLLSVLNGAATVTFCTASTPMVMTDWNYIELEFTIHDTTGSVKLYLNGVVVASATGIDTRNGGTGIVDQLTFVSSSATANPTFEFDDVYACDGVALGDCVVDLLLPAGAGASTGWVPSTAPNWSAVDDFSATDYVGTPGGATQKDLYTTTHVATTLTGTVVYATQADVLVMKSDAGTPPGPVRSALRSVGGTQTTDDLVAAASLTTAAVQYYGPVKNADPNGDPWTLARLDGMQIGVAVP